MTIICAVHPFSVHCADAHGQTCLDDPTYVCRLRFPSIQNAGHRPPTSCRPGRDISALSIPPAKQTKPFVLPRDVIESLDVGIRAFSRDDEIPVRVGFCIAGRVVMLGVVGVVVLVEGRPPRIRSVLEGAMGGVELVGEDEVVGPDGWVVGAAAALPGLRAFNLRAFGLRGVDLRAVGGGGGWGGRHQRLGLVNVGPGGGGRRSRVAAHIRGGGACCRRVGHRNGGGGSTATAGLDLLLCGGGQGGGAPARGIDGWNGLGSGSGGNGHACVGGGVLVDPTGVDACRRCSWMRRCEEKCDDDDELDERGREGRHHGGVGCPMIDFYPPVVLG